MKIALLLLAGVLGLLVLLLLIAVIRTLLTPAKVSSYEPDRKSVV